MKKTPQQKEIEWRKIKLIKGGANGIEADFSYLEPFKGTAVLIDLKGVSKDAEPHDTLMELFRRLKPIAASLDGVDYAKQVINVNSFEATEIQKQIINAAVKDAMESIEVTGLNIYKKKDSQQVIISYNKSDKECQITGHSTSKVSLEVQNYGIEDLLEEIVEELKIEAYRYFYENVYADLEQTSIFDQENESEEEEEDEIEDAEIVDND